MRSVLFRSAMSCVLLALSLSVSAQEVKVESQGQAAVEAEAPAEAKAEATSESAVESKAETTPAAEVAAGNGIIGAPPAGKGQIVFFRPSKFVGGAVGFKVREGTTELGKLRSGNYFVAAVDPGTHEYTVHSEAKDVLTLEVEAGETYYVQGTISMGVMVGRPNLAPSDEATFTGMAAKLKRVQ